MYEIQLSSLLGSLPFALVSFYLGSRSLPYHPFPTLWPGAADAGLIGRIEWTIRHWYLSFSKANKFESGTSGTSSSLALNYSTMITKDIFTLNSDSDVLHCVGAHPYLSRQRYSLRSSGNHLKAFICASHSSSFFSFFSFFFFVIFICA